MLVGDGSKRRKCFSQNIYENEADREDDLLSLDDSILGSIDLSQVDSSTQKNTQDTTASCLHRPSEASQGILSAPDILPSHSDSGIGLHDRDDEHFNKLIDFRSTLLFNSTLDISFSGRNDSFSIDLTEPDETFYGLPISIKHLYEIHRGIKDLYKWQDDLLNLERLKSRNNMLLVLPTSGGKTLIAEILILKELICSGKNVIFILPYVSLVHEKVNSLSPFALELGFLIEEYAGSKGKYPPIKRRKTTVFISTIEKADILVNSLIEAERFNEIGLTVIDEFHLIGESSRGAIIESILIKTMHLKPDIHILALSATLGNPDQIATFLNGFVFINDFRPTSLQEYVKIEDEVYQVSYNNKEEPLTYIKKFKNISTYKFKDVDPDLIGCLVNEVIPNKSCLIFCPTKKNCENICELICKTLPSRLMEHKRSEKKALVRGLISEGNGNICRILRKTLLYGIAYHHSGLTAAERKVLEEAFLDNTICCICCTSTLAAGVNLPAARVILRSPYVASQFLSFNQYKQMVGRAGRAGFEERGESILLARVEDSANIHKLVTSSVGKCISQLSGEPLVRLILSSLSLKLAKSRSELFQLIKLSLLSKQWVSGPNMDAIVDTILEELQSSDTLVKVNDNIELTAIGRAAVKANISVDIAKVLYKDLMKFRERLDLSSHLHLLYIIVPYDGVEELNPEPDAVNNILLNLDHNLLSAAHVIGIDDRVISQVASGRKIKLPCLVIIRFFGALIIHRLLDGENLWKVAKDFNTSRGFIFSFLTMCSTFASAILRFCEVFPDDFWMYSKLLVEYPHKIIYCCSQELIELMELPAVRLGRARQLYNAGFKDIATVAMTEPRLLSKSIDMLPLKQARLIVSSAKMLLLSKAELLQEEAHDILEGMARKSPNR